MDIYKGGKRDLLENKFQILSNIHLGHRISTVFFITPLPPVGHISDVMLVWRQGNINKNCHCVTVLCTIIMVHKDTSSSYRSADCIGL